MCGGGGGGGGTGVFKTVLQSTNFRGGELYFIKSEWKIDRFSAIRLQRIQF